MLCGGGERPEARLPPQEDQDAGSDREQGDHGAEAPGRDDAQAENADDDQVDREQPSTAA